MTSGVDRRFVLGGLLALPACRSSDKTFDADVLVLGAGLSGLHAARLLAEEGKDVLVLEGSNRIGGRLHTLDHGALGVTEGGGEQIGASYARILDTLAQLGIGVTPDRPQNGQRGYYYNGQFFTPNAWQNNTAHPFAGSPFAGRSPGSPLFALAAKQNPLTGPEDWRDPQFRDFDISAEKFLSEAGLNTRQVDVIDRALNANSANSYSMLNLYRTLQLYSQSRSMGPSVSINGGAQRLPEAMAASLPRPVMTNQRVTKIAVHNTHVGITAASGKTFTASHCICSLPFPVLRTIDVQAPLQPSQRAAIFTLPYTQIYQVHFTATRPFWEQDGLPLDIWTDTPIERIFAGRNADGTPNGLFRAWVNGRGADIWSGRTRSNIRVDFTQQFETIRPSAKGAVNVLAIQDWTQANPLAGGAYMHWAPGQIGRWAATMGHAAGRLHFAGEHLSYLHTGMEGAMESGENAALAILG